jgi:predicted DNA binding CopG/RHH family protein
MNVNFKINSDKFKSLCVVAIDAFREGNVSPCKVCRLNANGRMRPDSNRIFLGQRPIFNDGTKATLCISTNSPQRVYTHDDDNGKYGRSSHICFIKNCSCNNYHVEKKILRKGLNPEQYIIIYDSLAAKKGLYERSRSMENVDDLIMELEKVKEEVDLVTVKYKKIKDELDEKTKTSKSILLEMKKEFQSVTINASNDQINAIKSRVF